MKLKFKNFLGRAIGALLLLGAIAAVFLYEVQPKSDDEAMPIRPIKSMLVGGVAKPPTLYFPGTVDADSQVDLSFEVAGRLIEFPAIRGTRVKKGDLLAKLDPRDYENQVKNAQADLERAQSSLDRIEKALKSQAVSQEDYSRALAERNKAEANLAIRKKALAETELTASFDGVVADTYVDNYDNIAAGQPILKLMDVSTLTITISLPQEYMLLGAANDTMQKAKLSVIFDWLPDTRCPARIKNYAATVDPVTRTYAATLHIDKTEDLILLPGIAGTLVVERASPSNDAPAVVPSDAVGYDSEGQPFVWVLAEDPDEPRIYTAKKQLIAVGERIGDLIELHEGLERGTRIATAGVTILTEGRRVHLIDERPKPEVETKQ